MKGEIERECGETNQSEEVCEGGGAELKGARGNRTHVFLKV